MRKRLRSGYTTGACAAAAAKAAALLLLDPHAGAAHRKLNSVEIPFPDGSRVSFKIHNFKLQTRDSKPVAFASVIKDAGDDPDVTHGAEIAAEARLAGARRPLPRLIINGGRGVGTVTKPGLPVPVGEPAINPVPRKMIRDAVLEAVDSLMGKASPAPVVEITISVPDGEELARKTLNSRLGITGGISILGTTGIVRPVSTEAWTATITASMDVAVATGRKEIVISAGRASEKAHMKKYHFPEESYVLMGDYLEYSLLEAGKHNFRKIHLCAQWAKMLKIAMATPQTHVRFGAIDIRKAVEFLNSLGIDIPGSRSLIRRGRYLNILLRAMQGQFMNCPCKRFAVLQRGMLKKSHKGYLLIHILSHIIER
ncbi:MAG: cobalamin biosynthesis protein CbiD [Deferribacteres bacterium]|nr:cobalamin biosynthesis protein CbiD [Deferribacteres bacterium]